MFTDVYPTRYGTSPPKHWHPQYWRQREGTDHFADMWTNITTTMQDLPTELGQLSAGPKIGVGVLGLCGAYLGARSVRGFYKRTVNNRTRVRKQAENAKSIKDLETRIRMDPLAAVRVAHISGLTFAELSKELKTGKIRPIDALKAYQTKAIAAHQKTNCLVEAIKEAEEWALALEEGPHDGALWGIPISIKDDVGIKGYDSTIGMIVKVDKPSPDDAEVLKVLRQAGAVPFVKTNVPQTELSFEPGNPINGLVHNPYRHGYGPGGSSSGEAALIASGGSILGIGSDIAGSIRVPAHFCGIYGFKPTPERISPRGMSLDAETVIAVRAVWGPLSRDVDSLVTSLRTLWEGGVLHRTDPECLPLPFDTQVYTSTKKLRIGYYMENGMSPTFSACVRAVNMTKDVLSDLGHELVPWSPPNPEHTFELGLRILQADGGTSLREGLEYDVIHPTACPLTADIFTPIWIKKTMATIISPLRPDIANALRHSCGAGDVYTNNKLTYALWNLRRAVHDSWNEAGLDAVICPPHAMVAPPIGNSELIVATCLFTFTYNAIHYPAGVLPVTKVQQADIDRLDQDFPGTETIHQQCKKAMRQSLDLPVGVMVASGRCKDEMSLRVMKMVEEGLKQRRA